jgi:hypothetical protein
MGFDAVEVKSFISAAWQFSQFGFSRPRCPRSRRQGQNSSTHQLLRNRCERFFRFAKISMPTYATPRLTVFAVLAGRLRITTVELLRTYGCGAPLTLPVTGAAARSVAACCNRVRTASAPGPAVGTCTPTPGSNEWRFSPSNYNFLHISAKLACIGRFAIRNCCGLRPRWINGLVSSR